MPNITASPETLMAQAPMTIEIYLRAAVRMLDDQFRSGYADSNPALVGQLVQAMALDFAASTVGKELGEMSDAIAAG